MLACVDVHYAVDCAIAACVTARDWTDSAPLSEYVARREDIAPYQPGAFYRRELPCLLDVLALVTSRPEVIVIDGYVWLGEGEPGLGAHLHEALGHEVAIVGVAKTRYRGAESARSVTRGRSQSPLFVTAVGMETDEAAQHVASMHGSFRIPTLLRRVDQLTRRSG
jgi:deoxyribonuclease V